MFFSFFDHLRGLLWVMERDFVSRAVHFQFECLQVVNARAFLEWNSRGLPRWKAISMLNRVRFIKPNTSWLGKLKTWKRISTCIFCSNRFLQPRLIDMEGSFLELVGSVFAEENFKRRLADKLLWMFLIGSVCVFTLSWSDGFECRAEMFLHVLLM